MFKKKKTYLILGLIILIIGGIYYEKTKPAKVTYTTETAKIGTIAKTVSATGEIIPQTEAKIAFKLNGQLKFLAVDVGDRVEKGEKIASIDKGTLEDQLAKAKNEVKIQKKTLANMKRHESVYSYQQKDIQKVQIKKAQNEVNSILTMLSETNVYAPLSGVVTKKMINVGENVLANSPILTIAIPENPEIEIDVSETDITKVKIGQTVKLTFDALPSADVLIGKVTEIEPDSTVIQDVIYYKIKVELNKIDKRLKLGMSVDAVIDIFQKKDVVVVPFRAVKIEGTKKYVEILEPENKIKKVNIQTGLRGDDGIVEITKGLQGGEKVVVLSDKK